MYLPYGQTRTRLAVRHALIAIDGHVENGVAGITGGARAVFPAKDVGTVGYS